jgi:hypothetical protein
MAKIPKTFRLSERACRILEKLAQEHSLSQTDIIEILLRNMDGADIGGFVVSHSTSLPVHLLPKKTKG